MVSFRVQNLHKPRPDWSPLGVKFKISDEHPRLFRMGVPPPGSQTSRFSVGFSGRNSEQTRKQPKEVFSRKHRANCLKAVPNYWCKIAKHCKQILLPEKNVYSSTWKETNVARTFQSISSRSLMRPDENGSGNIEIGLGYRRRARVSLSLGSYKTDNPK